MSRVFALIFLIALSSVVFAELPPSAYEKMQSEAPEVLKIHVLRVDVDSTDKADTRSVTMLAEVIKVGRSQSKVKPSDMITVKYQIVTHPPGWAGPGQVPILKDNTDTVAYLKALDHEQEYAPAAGAMSFDRF